MSEPVHFSRIFQNHVKTEPRRDPFVFWGKQLFLNVTCTFIILL